MSVNGINKRMNFPLAGAVVPQLSSLESFCYIQMQDNWPMHVLPLLARRNHVNELLATNS